MCITNSDTLIQFFEQYVPMYEKAAFERGYKEGKALAKTIIQAKDMTQEQKKNVFETADRMTKQGFSTVDIVLVLHLSIEEYNNVLKSETL